MERFRYYDLMRWKRGDLLAWEDKKYYYPIPESDKLTNPNLIQNPGW